ncbi:hypothetical protein ACWEQL_00605 [Kitasatospora sp. NPDC004240]
MIARIPRNSAGRPVPGNTPWYTSAEGQMVVRENAELGPHIACPCEPGRGTAAFGAQCPERQRELMAQRRCGVCSTAIEPTSQLVFIGSPTDNAYMEPPAHEQCAAYALRVCPVLSAEGAEPGLALAMIYRLAERRITGLGPDFKRDYTLFPYGAESARLFGVLDLYLAFPEAPVRIPARTWLADLAPQM